MQAQGRQQKKTPKLPLPRNRKGMLSHLVFRKAFIISGLFTLVLIIIAYSRFHESIDFNVSRRIDFYMRAALHQGPFVSPKLKIIVYDDRTAGYLDSPELSKDQWIDLIRKISPLAPKAIFIDKIFGFPVYGNAENIEFIKALRNAPPVYASAIIPPQPLKTRYATVEGYAQEDMAEHMLGKVPAWLNADKYFAYGPHATIANAFVGIGHIALMDNNLIRPLVYLANNTYLPHLSVLAAKKWSLLEQELYINNERVPVNDKGQITVNLIEPERLKKNVSSMTWLIKETNRTKLRKFINRDDIVLILPNLFTGSTDFKDTPLGAIPGGFLLASMFNSVLTGQWLAPMQGLWFFIVLASLIALALGLTLSSKIFWPIFGVVSLAIPILSIYIFSAHSVMISWLYPTLAFVGQGIFAFAYKAKTQERKTQSLKVTLEGLLPKDQFNAVIANPDSFDVEAKERIVTLLFIDVEGYSRVSELYSPKECFNCLKELMAELTETVHKYDGIVNKTIGDGMLCYFGFRFDNKKLMQNHADKALACAIEIQKNNSKRILAACKNNKPIFPLRLGINTAPVFLGNLGGVHRIDFTVIGHGVNYAQRLEAACESHRIMLGATTREFLHPENAAIEALNKRYVQIKHHSEPTVAFEFNPFHNNNDLFNQLKTIVWDFYGVTPSEERHLVPDECVEVHSEHGVGKLIDFSVSGFSIKLSKYLAKDLKISLSLDSASGALNKSLKGEDIIPIRGSVRSGRPTENGYVHGIIIESLNDQQKLRLVEILKDHLRYRRRGLKSIMG